MSAAPESVERARPPGDAGRARWWFAGLLALEAALTAFLIAGRRIPDGHDGLQYFIIEYYFLSNAMEGHQVAQWMTYMTHGTVATWWYTVSAGLFQSVALQAGSALRWVGPLAVAHLGFFTDQVILLVGTWLLGRRYFARAETSAYVCACVLGAALWVDQPWFNLHFYYAFPLVLHLGHRFLESGRWRYAAGAANLLAVQTLGNMPYYIPMVTLLVGGYFGLYAGCNARVVWAQARAWRWDWRAGLAAVAGAGSLYLAYKIVSLGAGSIINYNPGRGADGTVSLDVFQTYGGEFTWAKWSELWLRVPAGYDNLLYSGMLLLPLALYGAGAARRESRPWLLLGAIMLLLTMAWTPLAALVYYVWPAMKFYRHLLLMSSFLRLPLCFLAGFGFEQLLTEAPGVRPGFARLAAGLLAVVCVAAAGELMVLARDAGTARAFFSNLNSPHMLDNPLVAQWGGNAGQLWLGAGFALGAATLLAARAAGRGPAPWRWLAPVALALTLADVYSFKFEYLCYRTDSVQAAPDLVAVQPFPFAAQRQPPTASPSPRLRELQTVSHFTGGLNWTLDTFLFADNLDSEFRCDHWLLPLDHLMKAAWGQPLGNTTIAPLGWRGVEGLFFPAPTPAMLKITGVTPGRVQFFDQAWTAPDDDTAAAWLTNPAFTGDALVLDGGPPGPAETAPANPPLAEYHRLTLSYEVTNFDANHAEFKVHNPTGHPAWLLYCDVWHEDWSATVNGRPTTVRRADLAYKAVALAPGDNDVALRFAIPGFAAIAAFFAACAAGWLVALAGWVARLLGPPGG